MKIKKGMYIFNESENPDEYYERALKDVYLITDDEDLQLGLND